MAYTFTVRDQAQKGTTMALRVKDTQELAALAAVVVMPDLNLNYASLQDFLDIATTATARQLAYVRPLDVIWLRANPFGAPMMCADRRFHVQYTGPVLPAGQGFSSQGYVVLEPAWNVPIRGLGNIEVQAEYLSGGTRDTLIVLP